MNSPNVKVQIKIEINKGAVMKKQADIRLGLAGSWPGFYRVWLYCGRGLFANSRSYTRDKGLFLITTA